MVFVKFPLAKAPMILEALPAGVSICGRLRLPSRSSTSSNSGHSPCRNFWKRCIVYAFLFLALREGCSCGSGGGGARSTYLGCRSRSFSARSRVLQSPVCWAVLIMESRSMRMARNGPWNDFGMCLCVGTVIVGVLIRSMGSSSSSRLLHVALVSSSPSLMSSASTPWLLSRSSCRSSKTSRSACEVAAESQSSAGGGVRSGVGGVHEAHGGVRSGVSVVPACTFVLVVAATRSLQSRLTQSARCWFCVGVTVSAASGGGVNGGSSRGGAGAQTVRRNRWAVRSCPVCVAGFQLFSFPPLSRGDDAIPLFEVDSRISEASLSGQPRRPPSRSPSSEVCVPPATSNRPEPLSRLSGVASSRPCIPRRPWSRSLAQCCVRADPVVGPVLSRGVEAVVFDVSDSLDSLCHEGSGEAPCFPRYIVV